MNRLYLVRHGENWANITKEFSHKKVDYSLTPKGVMQSQQTALFFKDKDIHEIYSSPLKRAVETAQIIGDEIGVSITILENFREMNVGSLEGQPPTVEIWNFHNQFVLDWLSGHPERSFPGGENFFTLQKRMLDGLEQILAGKTNRNILIIGHGGIFTLNIKRICPEVDMNWLFSHENHNCSISEILIEYDPTGQLIGKLMNWASVAHLSGEAANLIHATLEDDSFSRS